MKEGHFPIFVVYYLLIETVTHTPPPSHIYICDSELVAYLTQTSEDGVQVEH